MDWDKEDIINRVARRLPNKAYRQKMTVAELKAYFEMVYDEALITQGVMQQIELLDFVFWYVKKPELIGWNFNVIMDLYKNDKKANGA